MEVEGQRHSLFSSLAAYLSSHDPRSCAVIILISTVKAPDLASVFFGGGVSRGRGGGFSEKRGRGEVLSNQ